MSSFCLNNGFRLQKTNRAARRWKQPPKKPFLHVSRDEIFRDSWSISAALAFPTGILNEEKALGTRLDTPLSFQGAACENGGRELGLSL